MENTNHDKASDTGKEIKKTAFTKRALAAAAIAGAIFGHGAPKVAETAWDATKAETGHEFTEAELREMPQEFIKVESGDSSTEIVEKIMPALDDKNEQGYHDVVDYVQEQGIAGTEDNPQLKDLQGVNVPVIPEYQKPADQ